MEKLFFFSAILGSIFVLLQFAMTILGLGGDDMGADTDADSGDAPVDGSDDGAGAHFLRSFSTRTLAAFVAFFGLSGLACQRFGAPTWLAAAVALLFGLIAFVAVYYLLKALSSFNSDGSLRSEDAIGAEGTVYLTIPESRSGQGKATIVQQERTVEYDAVTDEPTELPTGAAIVVKEVLAPSLLLVAKR